MQIFLTVISGVVIFVAGQIIQMFLIQPILELKQIIGRISYQLTFFSNVYTSVGSHKKEVYDDAITTFRESSCALEERYMAIPLQSFFCSLHIIPSKKEIAVAATKLIFLSNDINDPSTARDTIMDNENAASLIRKSLYITRFR